MNRKSPRYRIRTQTTLLNSIGALALLGYGWLCWTFDIFYIPQGGKWYDRSLHGLGCKLMVGVLICIAILMMLPVMRAYLKPTQRGWCEKAWWPVASVAIALFGAALVFGWFNKL